MWDNYGPNAMSNAIIREADRLSNLGMLWAKDSIAIYNTLSRTYESGPNLPVQPERDLDFTELEFIQQGVNEHGSKSIQEIIQVSKETLPAKKANQYERLQLIESPDAKAFRDCLLEDGDYLAELDQALRGVPGDEAIPVWDGLKMIARMRVLLS